MALAPAHAADDDAFDVVPDGWFLLSKPPGADDRPDAVIIVQNFFAELRSRVKPK